MDSIAVDGHNSQQAICDGASAQVGALILKDICAFCEGVAIARSRNDDKYQFSSIPCPIRAHIVSNFKPMSKKWQLKKLMRHTSVIGWKISAGYNNRGTYVDDWLLNNLKINSTDCFGSTYGCLSGTP